VLCFFVSDLHGSIFRYQKLFELLEHEKPEALFMGGDLLPSDVYYIMNRDYNHYVLDFLIPEFKRLRDRLGVSFPRIFLILGNDDSRRDEELFIKGDAYGLWTYIHNKKVEFDDYIVYGYSYVPPSPFKLKDWERYDVSRYVDPGCLSPEDGWYSIEVPEEEKRYATIRNDLEALTGNDSLKKAIFLFHGPPYLTSLDRAGLDGYMIDHVPLDVHIGSLAMKKFIELRQPLLTLHGHIHESSRLTGSWRDKIGTTHAFNAAHDGLELSLIRFDPAHLNDASRELIKDY